VGYKFPDSIYKPETLEKRYVGKLSRKAVSFMAGMLAMNPAERHTALDCLADPYFDEVRDPETEKLISTHRAPAHQARIRQESSKSRSSMRSGTLEREQSTGAKNLKNKTSYGGKFLANKD
jgi:cyclin-dependent kinase-like